MHLKKRNERNEMHDNIEKILKMNLVRVNFVEMPAQIGLMSMENKGN